VTVVVASRKDSAAVPSSVAAAMAAALPVCEVLERLGSGAAGLPEDEAARRDCRRMRRPGGYKR
jgi:hypothetical protein